MSSLRLRNGTYHACFRYQSKQYDRSLKTDDHLEAKRALNRTQCTLQSLHYGHLKMAAGCEPGDFIISGGVRTEPEPSAASGLTLADAIQAYLESQQNKAADSYLSSQRTHLRHLVAYLGQGAEQTLYTVTSRRLEGFVEPRLQIRDANTVVRERNTLQRFFNWLVGRGYLDFSPAANLEPIKAGRDLPPFRTVAEIEAIIERGGLDEAEENNRPGQRAAPGRPLGTGIWIYVRDSWRPCPSSETCMRRAPTPRVGPCWEGAAAGRGGASVWSWSFSQVDGFLALPWPSMGSCARSCAGI